MLAFSTGKLIGVDSTGAAVEFGLLQDVQINFTWDKKELYGSLQFPRKVCRAKGKIEGKAQAAEIRADMLNLIMASTASTGSKIMATETGTVPASTPWQITVTNSTKTPLVDLGVMDVSDPTVAKPMKKVASAPAAGQYTFDGSTGKYTFVTGDAGKKVQCTYQYTESTTGTTITIGNPQMGTVPIWQMHTQTTLDGKQIYVCLTNCVSNKLDMNIKLEDFVIPSFDFSAFSDSSGGVGYVYIAE